MSAIKQHLPESVDVTDPHEAGYGPMSDTEPSATDWAVANLFSDISILEEKGAIGYISELKEARARLQGVINKTLKPF